MSKGKILPNRTVICYGDKRRIVSCHDCIHREVPRVGEHDYNVVFCLKHRIMETWNEALRCKDFVMKEVEDV